jgi:hypothetical protein
MSTILKALRRLEREKSAQSDRPLGEAVVGASPASPPPRRSARWLVAGGSVAVALAIAVAAFLVVRSGGEGESADPVEVAAVPQKKSPTPSAAGQRRRAAKAQSSPRSRRERPAENPRKTERRARRTEPTAPPGLSPAALSSKVEVLKRIQPETPSTEPTAAEVESAAATPRTERENAATAAAAPGTRRPGAGPPRHPATPTTPAASTEERVQLAAAAPAVKPPPTPRAEPEPEPKLKPEPAAEAPPKPAPPAAKPEPILRSPVPGVYVERTIWHPDASQRLAVVELEGQDEALELREGDVVGPLVVGKIEPSGVFFYHDGIELRRRVGAR